MSVFQLSSLCTHTASSSSPPHPPTSRPHTHTTPRLQQTVRNAIPQLKFETHIAWTRIDEHKLLKKEKLYFHRGWHTRQSSSLNPSKLLCFVDAYNLLHVQQHTDVSSEFVEFIISQTRKKRIFKESFVSAHETKTFRTNHGRELVEVFTDTDGTYQFMMADTYNISVFALGHS